MPYYTKSMPKHCTITILAILLALLLTAYQNSTETMTKAKSATQRSQELRTREKARKKAQNPTTILSHMQFINLKMKNRFNEQRKLALHHPLYKRALLQELPHPIQT